MGNKCGWCGMIHPPETRSPETLLAAIRATSLRVGDPKKFSVAMCDTWDMFPGSKELKDKVFTDFCQRFREYR